MEASGGQNLKSEKVRAGSTENLCRKRLQVQTRACSSRVPGLRDGWQAGNGDRGAGRASRTTPSPDAVGRSLRDRGARGQSCIGRPHVRYCARCVVRSPTWPRQRASTTGGTSPFRDRVLITLVNVLKASAPTSFLEQCDAGLAITTTRSTRPARSFVDSGAGTSRNRSRYPRAFCQPVSVCSLQLSRSDVGWSHR